MKRLKSYTVNTEGNNIRLANLAGYHAYYADNVTAIELKAVDKNRAKLLIKNLGLKVLYIFE